MPSVGWVYAKGLHCFSTWRLDDTIAVAQGRYIFFAAAAASYSPHFSFIILLFFLYVVWQTTDPGLP